MKRVRKPTILVAEDDLAQRDILSELLEYEDYRVLPADSPAKVMVQLGRHPDVVLLDVQGMADPEVKRALQARNGAPALLLLSGDSRLSELARELGADHALAKPYELDDLLGCLSELTSQGRRARS